MDTGLDQPYGESPTRMLGVAEVPGGRGNCQGEGQSRSPGQKGPRRDCQRERRKWVETCDGERGVGEGGREGVVPSQMQPKACLRKTPRCPTDLSLGLLFIIKVLQET